MKFSTLSSIAMAAALVLSSTSSAQKQKKKQNGRKKNGRKKNLRQNKNGGTSRKSMKSMGVTMPIVNQEPVNIVDVKDIVEVKEGCNHLSRLIAANGENAWAQYIRVEYTAEIDETMYLERCHSICEDWKWPFPCMGYNDIEAPSKGRFCLFYYDTQDSSNATRTFPVTFRGVIDPFTIEAEIPSSAKCTSYTRRTQAPTTTAQTTTTNAPTTTTTTTASIEQCDPCGYTSLLRHLSCKADETTEQYCYLNPLTLGCPIIDGAVTYHVVGEQVQTNETGCPALGDEDCSTLNGVFKDACEANMTPGEYCKSKSDISSIGKVLSRPEGCLTRSEAIAPFLSD